MVAYPSPQPLHEWLFDFGKPHMEKAGYHTFLRMMDRDSRQVKPTHVIEAVYEGLRRHSYDISDPAIGMRYASNIDAITGLGTAEIHVKEENGWHYRLPENRKQNGWSTKDKAQERISINAYAEPELVAKLDAFCCKHKAYYKTPDQLANWQERHDTVTMYFHEPVTPEMEAEIARIAQPHIRGHGLFGKQIAPGIALETVPQLNEIEALIARAAGLHPDLGKEVKRRATRHNPADPSKPEIKLSSGDKRAIEIVLDEYEAHLRAQAAPSVPGKPAIPDPLAADAPPPSTRSVPTLSETAPPPVSATGGESTLKKMEQAATNAADKSGGGKKWILGGMAVAGLAVGAVMYARSEKKNHVGQENERRMKSPDGPSVIDR